MRVFAACAAIAACTAPLAAQAVAPAPPSAQGGLSKTTTSASTTTTAENRAAPASTSTVPASPDELRAFKDVSFAFAGAWAFIALMREITRWIEFKVTKAERLAQANTASVQALTKLTAALQANDRLVKMSPSVVADVLEELAKSVRAQAP
jgi:hypothetical protein